MSKIQDIVSVSLSSPNSEPKSIAQSTPIKPKVALRIKRGDMDLTFYNGCDKYILYTTLKELTGNDR